MNTADRSIAQLDTALRRRFRFEELAPDSTVPAFQKAQTDTGLALAAMLDAMNKRIDAIINLRPSLVTTAAGIFQRHIGVHTER